MSVSAIIVNYYTYSYLPELLSDLAALKDVEQVFIVDNSGEVIYEQIAHELGNKGFSNFYTKKVATELEYIQLLKPSCNIGFGAGVNLAASKASSEYLLVINPDIRLFPNCLENLLNVARKYGSVLTGPRFFWDEAKRYRLPPSQGATPSLDYSLEAANFNRLEFEHLSFYWQMRHERFWSTTTPFPELFISGACLLINREWARKNSLSSLFDERFFLYFEDNDISLRALFDGIYPICVPDAEALHHYDQSPSPEQGKGRLMANSHALFADKYYGDIGYTLNNLDKTATPRGFYLPEIVDIGEINLPFYFDLKCLDKFTESKRFGLISSNADSKQYLSNLYFEIGVNPFFVPFAQTLLANGDFDKALFKIDDSIWSKLAKGVYYTRIRDSIKGTLKIWKWQKV